MAYLLGLDGGGTKTECIVLDAQGNVVGKGLAGPSNPLRCGFDTAFQSLSEAAAAALKEAKLPHAAITACWPGPRGRPG